MARPQLLADRRGPARPPSTAPQPHVAHRVPGRFPSVAPPPRASCSALARPSSAAPPASTTSLGGVQPEIHRRARFHMLNVGTALTTLRMFSWTNSEAMTKVIPFCGALIHLAVATNRPS